MSFLATLVLFGLAFIVLPFGSSWYEIPKVIIGCFAIGVLSFLFFWNNRNWKKLHLSPAPMLCLLGVFLLSLGTLLTQRSTVTFFGNAFRMQGVLLLWLLMLWGLVAPHLTPPSRQHRLARFVLLATLLIALLGQTDQALRSVGSLGEANSLGAFALFLQPLTASPLGFLASIVIIFLSGSRSALIGLVAGASLLVLSKRIKLSIAVIVALLMLASSLMLPFFETKRDSEYRADIWRTAIEAGREKPILGWGIGNVELGIGHAADTIQTFPRFQYVDSSHNLFLDWWVQGGIVGVLLFATLVIASIIGLIRSGERLLLASLVGMLAVMLFNPVSTSILVPFWWTLGVGCSNHMRLLDRHL